jgi:putative CocE/NonD family hydrolase
MSALDNFLYMIVWYVMDQARIFGTTAALVVVGRLLYTIFLFLSLKVVLPASESISGEIKPASSDPPRKFSWGLHFLGEFVIILLGVLNNYLAVGVLAYSILGFGRLMRSSLPWQKQNLTLKICSSIGLFWNPVFVILAYLGLIATFFGGVPLYGECIAVFIAHIVYFLHYHSYTGIQSLTTFVAWQRHTLWGKIPRGAKAGFIIALVATPIILGGLVYLRVYPKSEVYMVEMRDGVRLKTRVYLPNGYDGTSQLPVVLCRTPYNIQGLDGLAYSYVPQGYAVVTQDMRGCYGSEGGPFPVFRSDAEDGYDTCAWIVAQPWSNGKIASIGGSAVAINQIAYHGAGAPGIQAASIIVGSCEMYEYGFYPGGCFKQNLSETWIPLVMTHVDTIPEKLAAGLNQIQIMIDHPLKDSFYENVSLKLNNRYENINVRAVHVGGWYDLFSEGTIQSFMLYNRGTDYAKNHQFLVMGPWNHGIGGTQPDITFPANARDTSKIGYLENLLFRELFKNESIDWDSIPRVYYYVMGDPAGEGSTQTYNHWRTAMNWPIDYTPQAWYFHPNGTLSIDQPNLPGIRSYLYDPTNPVQSIGGTSLTLRENGASDQREVEYTITGQNRSDILKFTTPTLSSPVEIVGNLSAQLYITSNCSDTDFAVKLIDIYPDGKELIIGDGILKTRYRDGFQTSNLMNNGSLYELTIDMWSTAYRFVPGHQIRISITSSHYNKYALNPNTGGPVQNTHISDLAPGNYFIANNSVYCGQSGYNSCVWFPRTA